MSKEALRRGGHAILAALAFTAAGCRGAQQRAEEARETASSVAASAAMLAEARRDGRVSRAFARTACDALYQQLEKARASVTATPADRADERLAQAAARLESTADTVVALARAVDEDPRR